MPNLSRTQTDLGSQLHSRRFSLSNRTEDFISDTGKHVTYSLIRPASLAKEPHERRRLDLPFNLTLAG